MCPTQTQTYESEEIEMPYEAKPQVAIPRAKEVRESAAKANVPAVRRPSLPAATSNAEYRNRYLDEVAPASIVGEGIKFGKDGFIKMRTEEEVSGERNFEALCDQTIVGWQKFNGPGQPPDREMGLLYGSDYIMPARETLGDLDESKWEKRARRTA
jgi:hypothetical protein